MADLILHHYPTSPFAEKVRLILGYKKLAWKSVIIPMIMPKPDVAALTGGYRKTPVLQIGADIYCDTALIADVLEHLQPEPSLYPEPSKGMGRTLAQWADTTLFWTAMAYNFQPAGTCAACLTCWTSGRFCSVCCPALRTLPPTTRYGSPAPARLPWPAF